MRYYFWRASVVAIPILATIAALMVVVATSSGADTSPAEDCLVDSEPSVGGPSAPSDLLAEPIYGTGIWPNGPSILLTWEDTSDDETCFVLERGDHSPPAATESDLLAVLPGDLECAVDVGNAYLDVDYRVYAANETARSEYSNIATVYLPIVDPPPGYTPSPISPSQVPGCPLIGATTTPTPTAGPLTPTPFLPVTGDLNCDGKVDALDALRILQYLAGLQGSIGCPG